MLPTVMHHDLRVTHHSIFHGCKSKNCNYKMKWDSPKSGCSFAVILIASTPLLFASINGSANANETFM